MKKHLAVIGIVTAVGATGAIGAGVANAATTGTNSDPMSSLASTIATKFNLNKDEVQKVFDEQRSAMQTERENEIKNEIAQLVKDGKLTQDQADKINAKRTELEKEREANRTSEQTKTNDQRTVDRDARKTAIDTWLEDNDIDSQYGYLLMGGHGHRGPGGHEERQSSDSDKTGSSNSASSATKN